MRIEFEMSGGIGGLFAQRPLAVHIDVEGLPPEVRQKLLDLVATSGLRDLDPAAFVPASSKVPDVFQYRLMLTEAGTTHTFAFNDTNVPQPLRPLLQFLQQRATDERLKGT